MAGAPVLSVELSGASLWIHNGGESPELTLTKTSQRLFSIPQSVEPCGTLRTAPKVVILNAVKTNNSKPFSNYFVNY